VIHPLLRNAIRPTTFVTAPRLNERAEMDIIIATETFQHTGSFKFRAAMNVALSIPNPRVVTASSGNFGQALAYACRLTGKGCVVVMPDTSARVKVDAVREYGADVDLIDVCAISRAARVAELALQYPDAYIASAYDDDLVIDGNSTLAEELCARDSRPDVIVAPVGGGGLTAGLVRGIQRSGNRLTRDESLGSAVPSVVGAEPLLANDAARSLREGRIVRNELEPQTIADGTRTVSLGDRNWTVLREGLAAIVEVPEEAIAEAVRMLFTLANLKAEPTGALSLAACLTDPQRFRDRRVCCVVSGGNVDPGVYAGLIGG
jgi:threonine dehydratase